MSNYTDQILDNLRWKEAQADALKEQVRDLQALLDHYRGTCPDCGREDVLLEYYEVQYDGMSTRCLEDQEGCQAIVLAKQEAERKEWQRQQATARRAEAKVREAGLAHWLQSAEAEAFHEANAHGIKLKDLLDAVTPVYYSTDIPGILERKDTE